jgi:hypothetical protein
MRREIWLAKVALSIKRINGKKRKIIVSLFKKPLLYISS